jgi:hypothetical protein
VLLTLNLSIHFTNTQITYQQEKGRSRSEKGKHPSSSDDLFALISSKDIWASFVLKVPNKRQSGTGTVVAWHIFALGAEESLFTNEERAAAVLNVLRRSAQ